LRDHGLETGEVIEDENIARVEVAVHVMDLDVEAKVAFQDGERPHAPAVRRFVKLWNLSAVHRTLAGMAVNRFRCIH